MKKASKFLLVLLIALTVWAASAPLISRWLVVEVPMERADAIFVLSGSSVFQQRIEKAAQLYHDGVAKRIVITNDGQQGGWSTADMRNPYFVELEQRQLIASGVEQGDIVILQGVMKGTDDEAKAASEWAATAPDVRSVLLVTSPYHTRRALRTFRKALDGSGISVGITMSDPTVNQPDANFWWLSSQGWRSVGMEYVKMAVYSVFK